MCFRWLSIKDWNRLLIFVANLFQAGTAETVLVAVLQLVSLVRGKLHIRAPTTGESGAAGKIVAARFADDGSFQRSLISTAIAFRVLFT